MTWKEQTVRAFQTKEGESVFFLPVEGMASIFFQSDVPLSYLEKDKAHTSDVTFSVYDRDGKKSTDGYGRLKGHGNTSFASHPKKSLDLKMEEAIPLLGMNAQEKWVFIANYADDTALRNRIAYETACRMGCAYSPESDYVNVWFNGEYRGLYLLCHKVDVAGGCVGIRNLESLNKGMEPSDISGGYLMEFSGEYVYREAQAAFRTPSRYIIVKSPNNLTENEEAFITEVVGDVEKALEEVRTEAGFQSLCDACIDLRSWTEQFWLQEFFCNVDAEVNSAFFYKEQGDERLYAGPIWDMDRCATDWSGHGLLSVASTQALMIEGAKAGNGSWGEMPWLKRMYRIDGFRTQAFSYYEETFYPVITGILKETAIWRIQTEEALAMDCLRWEKDVTACIKQQEELTEWIEYRRAFWADYCRASDSYEVIVEERKEDVWRDLVYCVR